MAKRVPPAKAVKQVVKAPPSKGYQLKLLNDKQKEAWATFEQNDVVFATGPAGTGKSHLACAYAASQVLAHKKERIILTRPIVEAGASLGFLPGTFEEKVHPYMVPMFDCIRSILGADGPQRDFVNRALEIAPISYLRGRTFQDAVCIFDEAQNATWSELKLFLTRFGKNCKVIVTGDPVQSDIRESGLASVAECLRDVPGIGYVEFDKASIVRHPLVAMILERMEVKPQQPPK